MALGIARFFVFTSLLLLVGGGVFVAWLWPDGATSGRARRVLWSSLAGMAAATSVGLALDPPHERVWLIRLALVVPAAALLQLLSTARRVAWRMAAAAVAIGLLLTLVVSGHAETGRWILLARAVDLLHLAAGAMWIGGLAVLFVAALRRDVVGARMLSTRFSRVAFAAIVVIAASGLAQSVRQVVGLAGLESTYGHVLAVKVAFALAAVGMASLTRSALAGAEVRAEVEPADDVHSLRRLAGAEGAIGVCVLAVTALLAGTTPGPSTAVGARFDQTQVVDDALLNVVVESARVGPIVIHLYVDNPGGGLTQTVDATGTFSLAAGGSREIDVPFVTTGPKHWTATGVDIPTAGTWALQVEVQLTPSIRATTTFSVPIGGSP